MFGSVIQERGVPSWYTMRWWFMFGSVQYYMTRANHIQFRALDLDSKKKIKKVLNNFVYNKKSIIFVVSIMTKQKKHKLL
jgi:hypothetical protein